MCAAQSTERRPANDRLATLGRAALDFLACAGLSTPVVLLRPDLTVLVLLAAFVVALTVVVPLEPPVDYRRHALLVRITGAVVFAAAIAFSVVVPEPSRRSLAVLTSGGTTAGVVLGIVAVCVALAALAAFREYRRGG